MIHPYVEPLVPRIVEILREVGVRAAYLIGSSITPYFNLFKSDIDLLIDCTPEQYTKLMRLLGPLEIDNFPMDVLMLSMFPYMIDEEKVKIYESNFAG